MCVKVLADQRSSIRPLGPGLETLNCSSSCQVSAVWFRCFTVVVKRKRKQLLLLALKSSRERWKTGSDCEPSRCLQFRQEWMELLGIKNKDKERHWRPFFVYALLPTGLGKSGLNIAAAHDLSRLLHRWKTQAAAAVFNRQWPIWFCFLWLLNRMPVQLQLQLLYELQWYCGQRLFLVAQKFSPDVRLASVRHQGSLTHA